MKDFILFMHDDAVGRPDAALWPAYITALQGAGRFGGGSSIGVGACERKSGIAAKLSVHLSGYIRVRAASLEEARTLLTGNPVFEAGGTVEIRELPQDG